jgi:hypothetical protein
MLLAYVNDKRGPRMTEAKTLGEWLEEFRARWDAWRFERRAVNRTIERACGHFEAVRTLPEWIAGMSKSKCSDCRFRRPR